MTEVARIRSGHPIIRQCAINILDSFQVESHQHRDEAICIGNWVKNNIAYVKDPDFIEYLQDPIKIIQDINTRGQARGDCDDMACFCAALLLSIGHQPYFRAVRYSSKWGHYNHIYVVDYVNNWKSPKSRLVIDCILKQDDVGTEVPHMSGDEYLI